MGFEHWLPSFKFQYSISLLNHLRSKQFFCLVLVNHQLLSLVLEVVNLNVPQMFSKISFKCIRFQCCLQMYYMCAHLLA